MTLVSDSVVGSKSKIFQLIVTLLYFMCGMNCIRLNSLSRICNISIVYLSLIVLAYAYVFFFVAGGDLSTFKLLSVEGDNRVISDYLLLATIIYPLLFFKIFSREKDVYMILVLFSSLFCISLGGRGPFIFLFLIIFLAVIKDFRRNLNMIIVGAFLFIVLVFYSGVFDVFFARLDSISSGDVSLKIRFKEYFIALESISNNVILGSGVGMSGMILGYGDVYAYPHNIILESWLELGIIGLFLVIVVYAFFTTHWMFCSKFKAEFWVGLVCLFYLVNALKSGSIYEQRYLAFYVGIFVYLRNNKGNVIEYGV